jgi:hypothetical protein
MDPCHLTQFVIGMGEKVDTFAPESMGEQDLGGEARGGDYSFLE